MPRPETRLSIGIGQDDPQVAVVFLLPVFEHFIGGLAQLKIGIGQRGIDHGQFVGIGADGLDILFHRDPAVRGAGEGPAQPLHHRLHAPVLPEVGMPPPRAEIGDAQAGDGAQPVDLFPQFGHRAGVENL